MKLDCVKIVSEMKRQRLTSMDLANKAMFSLPAMNAASAPTAPGALLPHWVFRWKN